MQTSVLGSLATMMSVPVALFVVVNVPNTCVGMAAASITVVFKVRPAKLGLVISANTFLPINGSR